MAGPYLLVVVKQVIGPHLRNEFLPSDLIGGIRAIPSLINQSLMLQLVDNF
jgi:hypothetical protein